MPKFLYPGDPFASRAEAIDWIVTGNLGIDFSKRHSLSGLAENRGQYFFENDQTQKLYSKFGFAHTLFNLPPLFVEQLLVRNPLALVHNTPTFICILNFYQTLFALLTAAYLYGSAGLYTERRWLQVVFVISTIYATYMWHYLRAPTHEVLQVAAIVGFYYHAMVFVKRSAAAGKSWKHLFFATLYVGILMFCKLPYALLLLPLSSLACLTHGNETVSNSEAEFQTTLFSRVREAWSNRNLYAVYLIGPMTFVLLLYMGMNELRFGSPFETGYRQWCDEHGQPLARLSIGVLLESIPALVFRLGNANIFIHYPPLLIAVFGLPAFWRRFRRDAIFISLACAPSFLVLSCFSWWHGEWCYGPRYFLPYLIIASFPAIIFVEQAMEAIKTWGAAALAVVLITLLCSFRLQANVIATHYFVFHYTSTFFGQVKLPDVSDYFDKCPHRGLVHGDILAHRYGYRAFYPIREIEQRMTPDQAVARQQMRNFVDGQAELNFYWIGNR
jgi:hypothetical protein